MADVTRPATWEDVKTLARLLDEEGTRWALIGARRAEMLSRCPDLERL
jgi:hypothetical protein